MSGGCGAPGSPLGDGHELLVHDLGLGDGRDDDDDAPLPADGTIEAIDGQGKGVLPMSGGIVPDREHDGLHGLGRARAEKQQPPRQCEEDQK